MMIIILTGTDKAKHRDTIDQMFRGRADVFHRRLGWKVIVRGEMERDRCDELEDLTYVVALHEMGSVVGSLRLLPIIGETMLRNEFTCFFPNPVTDIPVNTWECSRFCVHSRSEHGSSMGPRLVSSELLIGLCEHAISCGVEHIVGLYEAGMTRVYRRIGWTPRPLAQVGSVNLVLGIWDVSDDARDTMRQRRHYLDERLKTAARTAGGLARVAAIRPHF